TPLSAVPRMDAVSVTTVLSRLDRFLESVHIDLSSSLAKIVSSRLAKQASRQILRMFSAAYRGLCEAVMDPRNRYEYPSTILVRTADEVEMLLMEE
ncbi:hypothetical protein DFQ26_008792, partial [Actinomortierella ambigua]